MELLYGSVREFLIIGNVVLATMLLWRVRLFFLGIEWQISLVSFVYLLLIDIGCKYVALPLALIVATLCLFVFYKLTTRFGLDSVLVSLALGYVLSGVAQISCLLKFGNAAQVATLQPMLGEHALYIMSSLIILAVIVSDRFLTPLRLSRVIADSQDFSELRAIPIAKWQIIAITIAGAQIALASATLVEHGGAFTSSIAAYRGFLALAIVLVVDYSMKKALVWSFGFAVLMKLKTFLPMILHDCGFKSTSPYITGLIESLPYLAAIILSIWGAIRVINQKRLQAIA